MTEANPWRANTLEWTTAPAPPHGNWEGEIPGVHRGPYEYEVAAATRDYVMQHEPPEAAAVGVP